MEDNLYNNVNEIDMECKGYDDDIDELSVANYSSDASHEKRDLNQKTGIIINLNDDEDLDVNAYDSSIDLETDYPDDDFEEKELIDDDILESRKKKKIATSGEVEADYWKKITARHKKSNKKGAYNTSFHFAGDPEKEAEFFNHAMGSDFADTDLATVSGNITGSSSGDSAMSDGGGMGESLNENYSNTLNKLLECIGFELIKNSDGSLTILDDCGLSSDTICQDIATAIKILNPFIHDYLIGTLQVTTGESFDNYNDWVIWYKDDKIKNLYPDCSDEVNYCDLIANNIDKCY